MTPVYETTVNLLTVLKLVRGAPLLFVGRGSSQSYAQISARGAPHLLRKAQPPITDTRCTGSPFAERERGREREVDISVFSPTIDQTPVQR